MNVWVWAVLFSVVPFFPLLWGIGSHAHTLNEHVFLRGLQANSRRNNKRPWNCQARPLHLVHTVCCAMWHQSIVANGQRNIADLTIYLSKKNESDDKHISGDAAEGQLQK